MGRIPITPPPRRVRVIRSHILYPVISLLYHSWMFWVVTMRDQEKDGVVIEYAHGDQEKYYAGTRRKSEQGPGERWSSAKEIDWVAIWRKNRVGTRRNGTRSNIEQGSIERRLEQKLSRGFQRQIIQHGWYWRKIEQGPEERLNRSPKKQSRAPKESMQQMT